MEPGELGPSAEGQQLVKSFLKAVFPDLFLGDINEAAGNPYWFTDSVILPVLRPPLKLSGKWSSAEYC